MLIVVTLSFDMDTSRQVFIGLRGMDQGGGIIGGFWGFYCGQTLKHLF